MSKPEIKPGQIWEEKTKRKEYDAPRKLKVISLGDPEIYRADVTPVTYYVKIYENGNGDGVWVKSARTMYAFGLHKNWKLVNRDDN